MFADRQTAGGRHLTTLNRRRHYRYTAGMSENGHKKTLHVGSGITSDAPIAVPIASGRSDRLVGLKHRLSAAHANTTHWFIKYKRL